MDSGFIQKSLMSVGLFFIVLTPIFIIQNWSLALYHFSLYTLLTGSISFVVSGFVPEEGSIMKAAWRIGIVMAAVVVIITFAIMVAPYLTNTLLV